jgi:hypothetical protein
MNSEAIVATSAISENSLKAGIKVRIIHKVAHLCYPTLHLTNPDIQHYLGDFIQRQLLKPLHLLEVYQVIRDSIQHHTLF